MVVGCVENDVAAATTIWLVSHIDDFKEVHYYISLYLICGLHI